MPEINSAGLPRIGGNHWPNPSDVETAEILELKRLLEQARGMFARIECENAHLLDTLAKVRTYAQSLVGEWATGDAALDILVILDADKHDDGPVGS